MTGEQPACLIRAFARYGQVAQLVEQRTENPRVGGSIPSLATNIQKTNHSQLVFFARVPQCWRGFVGGWLWLATAGRERPRTAQARTARQLMDDVLTLNGIPLGWNIDWGLTDCVLPVSVHD